MGSGKSYCGKQLAKKLAIPFIDLDDYLESKEGRTIATIFEAEGEHAFRLLEEKYLQELLAMDNVVIAAGGGTPCFFDNLSTMNKHGLTVYLSASINVLFDRLSSETGKRPLLINKSREELRQYIEATLKGRSYFYRKARIIFPIKNDDDDIIDDLIAVLNDTTKNGKVE